MTEHFPSMLITCSDKILLWDGELHVIEEGMGLYYGLTWDEEFIYVASRRRQPGVVRVFDNKLNSMGALGLLYIGDDPHQLFYRERNILIADRDKFRVLAWNSYLRYESWHAFTDDDQHINSIWYGYPFYYVVHHRHDRPVKRIKLFTESWGPHRTVSFNVGHQDAITGHGIHNVYVEGGKLFTLAPYTVITLDLFCPNAGEFKGHYQHSLEGVHKGNHYLRGLAVTSDGFFIGVSNNDENGQRGEGDTFILKTDRELNVLGRLDLEDTGQILEVRVIGRPDFAHNMLRCPYVPNAR